MALFDNLIAYYKLDGNYRDSVNMYDGIPNNITFVDGKIGECAQSNGYSQYISLPNEVSVKGRTQVSYSGWCFIESAPNKDFLHCHRNCKLQWLYKSDFWCEY